MYGGEYYFLLFYPLISPFLICLAGVPITVTSSGISEITVAPAPTITFLPIFDIRYYRASSTYQRRLSNGNSPTEGYSRTNVNQVINGTIMVNCCTRVYNGIFADD